MKKLLFFLIQLFPCGLFACPACTKAQPEIFRGITHGSGPESKWDYLIVGVTIAIVLLCLGFTIKFLVAPHEGEKSHIKNQILNA